VSVRLGALALVLALVGVGASVDQARACTCAPPPEHLKSKDSVDAWRIAQATTVVRGKVIGVQVDAGTARSGIPSAVARFRTTSVIKGDVRIGEMEIVTSTQSAMCGIAGFLTSAAGAGQDVVLELARDGQGNYVANLCRLYSAASAMKPELISEKRK
jgi:hypothetical protein